MPFIKDNNHNLNCILVTEKNLKLRLKELDHLYIIRYPSVDVTVQDKDVVYKKPNNKYYPALADGTEKENVVGIYDAENDIIITCGLIKTDTNIPIGHKVYLSETNYGEFQSDPSNVTLGISVGNGYILFNPDKPNYDILDERYTIESENQEHLNNKANKDLSNVNDTIILNKLKNVDGAGSGLDADKLDGKQASDLANKDLSNVSNNTILAKLKNVDGSGSGLDADKLDGHDSSYFAKKDLTNVNDSTILNKIKNVDGPSSGLNADLLDGKQASEFAEVNHVHDNRYYRKFEVDNALDNKANKDLSNVSDDEFLNRINEVLGSGSGLDADKLDGHDSTYFATNNLSNVNNNVILNKLKNVDGAGSGLDADLLDGQHGSFYRNASNLNAGIIPAARLSGTYNISISGNAATATNADKLDGKHANEFALVGHNHDTKYVKLTDYEDSDVLTKIKNVDGTGSGLDADKLDGKHANEFALVNHEHDTRYVKLTDYEDGDVLTKIKNVDGAGSGLDSDLLDGHHGDFYRNASNLNTGTVPVARLSGTYNINISGNAASATNADKLDGKEASEFATNNLSNVSDNTILAKLKNVDGSGSELDADRLDGQHGSFYRNANNLNAGTVPTARLSGTYNINISGNAATATNADKVDNYHASQTSQANTIPVAGSDGKLDSSWLPDTIDDSWQQSFGENGYQKLPSGLIIQWGSNSVGGKSTKTVNFPISFPNACRSVVSIPKGSGSGGGNEDYWGVYNVSKSKFTQANQYDGSHNFYWIAIGY